MSQCANPLFTQWIKEKLDKAREHNTQGVNAYKKAYIAMRDSPLTYEHPVEAKMLQGIGDKLVKYLQDKLKKHCEQNGLPVPKTPKGKKRKAAADGEGGEESPSPSKKAKKTKPYVPSLRSGGYAIILALASLDEDDNTGLTKQQIISEGKEYTDSSFTVPTQTNSFYTAWNSIITLTNKNLVYEKKGGTKKYLLTPEGWECARSIKAASDPSQGRLDTFVEKDRGASKKSKSRTDSGIGFLDVDSPPPSPSRQSESPQKKSVDDIVPLGTTSSLPVFEPIKIPAGSFTVRLVLDNREVRAKQDRDFIQKALYEQGVEAIVRPLSLGDTLWVAKLTDPELLTQLGAEGDEILLDYIVERKRSDDLVASIKDTRFLEQKFRLRRSGVKNVIYVIEEFKMHDQTYAQHMQTAIASSQVVDGFTVKKTQTIHDTIKYLARMTKYIKSMYESKPLQVIPTSVITSRNYLPLLDHLRTTKPNTNFHITSTAFASLSSKSDQLTLRDVYIKMLMCMKGVSGEKALEIQKIWKTPAEFAEAFEKCGEGDTGKKKKMELVWWKTGNNVGRKRIAKALSVKISEVWGDVTYVEEGGDD
jgi:crossover junction endonuclease MUS81